MNSDSFNWDNQHMLCFKTVGKDNRTTSLERRFYKKQNNWGKIPCETVENMYQTLELCFLLWGTGNGQECRRMVKMQCLGWKHQRSLTPFSVNVSQPLTTEMENNRMFLMFIWPALITSQKSLTRRGTFLLESASLLHMCMEVTQTPRSLWARTQWSMRWTPSLHSVFAYAGTKRENTPGSQCFNKQQCAGVVAMQSIQEFGKYKAIMSKSHMFSSVTSVKVWKEPWPVENWLIQ